MSAIRKFTASVCALSLIAMSGAALADSGGAGGGGGAPSASAPRIDPVKRYQEGVQLLQAKDFKKAEKAFNDVLDAAPRDANSNFMMALANVGQQDFRNARKYLRNAVKFNANHVQARGWLGAIEAKLGDAEKAAEQKTALEDLKARCATACPEATQIEDALKRVQAGIDNPSADLVLAGLARGSQWAAGDVAYLAAAGLINSGRYESALGKLEQAGLAFGPHPDVLTYQGFANRKLGRRESALGFYTMALAIQREHRGANEYLGEYYVEIGDMAKARAQLGKLEQICAFGCEEAEELRRWIKAKS